MCFPLHHIASCQVPLCKEFSVICPWFYTEWIWINFQTWFKWQQSQTVFIGPSSFATNFLKQKIKRIKFAWRHFFLGILAFTNDSLLCLSSIQSRETLKEKTIMCFFNYCFSFEQYQYSLYVCMHVCLPEYMIWPTLTLPRRPATLVFLQLIMANSRCLG